MTPHIKRRSIFEQWATNPPSTRTDATIAFVYKELGEPYLPENIFKDLTTAIRNCVFRIEQKWKKSQRHRERFLAVNASWIDGNLHVPDSVIQALPGPSRSDSISRPGRRGKDFKDCVDKVKTRKVKNLTESTSQEELSKATEIKLRKAGKRDSAAIVKELASASPTRGTNIKKARKSSLQKPLQLSADRALALMVDAKLSTSQYNIIRQQAKDLNCKLYPAYYRVKEAKRECYPTNISVTDISAEIQLQSLIDHTVLRLCKAQEEVLSSLCLCSNSNINIIIKWGCDGAEQSRYRQRFSDQHCTDESLFSISMVPIQMYTASDNSKTIIWQNPAPSSTRYCRPIKFIFAKESVEVIRREVVKVENQISRLSPTRIVVNAMEVIVKSTLILCMIDGKVCNAVSSCTSTQTCYLCGAKPREMNDLTTISEKNVNENFLSFGLSPLHSWIRFFECLLHISYRLEIQSWQVRGIENKTKVSQKKKDVQEKFKTELGLLVDMPKQQTGNTNDGNTARKFFRNAQVSAEITGVSVELIKRFHVILECINSGFSVNVDKFGEYTKQTLELYIRLYSWYPMPVSVHKVLFHGRDIVASGILPIGQYSEEAQEARNEDNRQYRELFTRKTSRIDTNTDLVHRLLITSDPFIASLRVSPQTKHGKIMQEVLDMLEEPFSNNFDISADHSSSSE